MEHAISIQGEITKDIVGKIKEVGTNISFVELMDIPGMKGDEILWGVDGRTTRIFWAGLSKEAIQSINHLDTEEIIRIDPTYVATYLVDNYYINRPLAGSGKHMAWQPVVLNKGPKWVG
jgi:hypothetical protein